MPQGHVDLSVGLVGVVSRDYWLPCQNLTFLSHFSVGTRHIVHDSVEILLGLVFAALRFGYDLVEILGALKNHLLFNPRFLVLDAVSGFDQLLA